MPEVVFGNHAENIHTSILHFSFPFTLILLSHGIMLLWYQLS